MACLLVWAPLAPGISNKIASYRVDEEANPAGVVASSVLSEIFGDPRDA